MPREKTFPSFSAADLAAASDDQIIALIQPMIETERVRHLIRDANQARMRTEKEREQCAKHVAEMDAQSWLVNP